jgi:AraC-like DNA-binding protein
MNGVPSLEKLAWPTPEARVCCWRHESPRQAWPTVSHGAVELALVHSGCVAYRIGHRDLDVVAGMGVVVPAGHAHENAIETGTSATSLHLSVETAREIAAAMERPMPSDAVLLSDPKRLAILIGRLGTEDPDSLVEAIAVEMLSAIGAPGFVRRRERAGTASKDARIHAAVQKIEAEYARPLSVGELARSAHMSRFHFSRVFERETGRSPYRYLIDKRVERAAELLRSGRASVTEAALAAGFSDLGRFSRAFRRTVGLTPSEFRRALESRPRLPASKGSSSTRS